jgi:transposase-like protein
MGKRKKVESQFQPPVCPVCKEAMSVMRYRGYYESFVYWSCECDEDELGQYTSGTWVGQYG